MEAEPRGCDHDLRTMIEHFPLTVRYLIYSIPKAKCRPGHLNVNLLNIAITHSVHLQSLHHNPHYHQHQHQHGEFSRVCTSTKSKADVFFQHFLVFARECFKIT